MGKLLLYAAHLVDEAAGRIALDERHSYDLAAARGDEVSSDNCALRPVGSFDQNVWLERCDHLVGSFLIEDDDCVDACQRGEHLRALLFGVDGAICSFLERSNGPIRVDTNNQ